jgi:hypothetical protein
VTDQPDNQGTYSLVLAFSEPSDDFEGALSRAAAIIRDRLQTTDVAAMRLLADAAADAARLMESAPAPERRRIPRRIRADVLTGACCATCGATANLQVDHIIARSKGGPDARWNLQPLCAPCNQVKGVS